MTRRFHGRAARSVAATVAALLAFYSPATAASVEWELALPGYRYEFPRDHFNHPGYQTEWWYYTGNLRAGDGRRFGLELTFFRQGIARPVESLSPWDVSDLYLAHSALSDLDGRHFYHAERLNRAGPGLAGADLGSRRIWNGNWEVRFDPAPAGAQPSQQLQAISDEFSLRLALHSEKPPVTHGVGGVSQKAPGRGQASHYISYTRLEASGTLELGGRRFDVSGLAWMDHEFFTHQLTSDQTGWNWISVQLANGEELMLYRLRRRDAALDPFSAGTFVDARGVTRHLTAADFYFDPGVTWTSQETAAQYPLHWTIRVPVLGLDLDVRTPLNTQELVSQHPNWPTYWEGAITIEGVEHARPVTGVGYLEMTGYDRPVQLPQ